MSMVKSNSAPTSKSLYWELDFTDNGQSRLFNLFRKRLRFWEDLKTPQKPGERKGKMDKAGGGWTNQGMSEKELWRLADREDGEKAKKKGPGWLWSRDPGALSDDQITGIFRKEYFDKLNIEQIADTPDVAEQSVPLLEQLFDAGIHHGIVRPAKWLQQAINEQMPPEEGEEPLGVDGILGSGTRDALRRAAKAGKIEAISDTVARKRLAFLGGRSAAPSHRGWFDRAESFLSENYDPNR